MRVDLIKPVVRYYTITASEDEVNTLLVALEVARAAGTNRADSFKEIHGELLDQYNEAYQESFKS